MHKQDKIGYVIAIIGAIGLGLILGNEYTSSYITLIGAGLIIISILGIIIMSYKNKSKR